ncbi:hypothetical protein [Modestobacter sp. URMC 112]
MPTYPAPLGAPHDRSLLAVHARWVLTVTMVAVLSACALSWALTDPVYRSEARVLVNAALTPGGAPLPPDMETEREVAVSRAVTGEAAGGTGTTPRYLERRLSTSVPADSTVLVLEYTDDTAETARDRAQAVADAYLAFRAPQAALLSPASLPRSAVGPDYLLNGGAGLVVGLLVGLGSALLRDRLDDTVRGTRDLADAGLALLAPVPVAPGPGGGRLPVLDHPDPPGAEAYRLLGRKLSRAAGPQHRAPSVTVVTSAVGDDGAAAVVAGTGIALALGGTAVLLVDGDLRDPRLAELLDVAPGAGLGGVLTGAVPLGDAVQGTPVPGLRLLPAGEALAQAPGDVLTERPLRELLDRVPPDVGHVLVRTPPLLTAAETATMADHAHRVVVAATAGRTRRRDLRAAVDELRDAGAPVLGAVLSVPGSRRDGGRDGRPPGVPAGAVDHPREGSAVPDGERPSTPLPGPSRRDRQSAPGAVATSGD